MITQHIINRALKYAFIVLANSFNFHMNYKNNEGWLWIIKTKLIVLVHCFGFGVYGSPIQP